MTQEEKSLLLQDLCARLPYGVKCINICWPRDGHVEISNIDTNRQKVQIFEDWCDINDCKPYLRPMSSMTEKERKEYKHLVAFSGSPNGAANFVDWLNKKMFAYRTIDGKDMFELSLAIEAPEGMY